MAAPGCYLYAVIDGDGASELGPIGIDGGTVYTIADGPVAAVVSDVPNKRVRPERRKLAAHFEVLKRLLAERTVLPMAFGLIADDADGVRDILAANRESLAEQLQRFRGTLEMGVRVVWDVPNIFEYVVARSAELRAARDTVFAAGQPSQDQMIELGRMFEYHLSQQRRGWAERVVPVLRAAAGEVKELKPKGEKDVMNLACLVAADGRGAFDAAVAEAAAMFGDEFVVEFTGPFPPHNFISIQL